MKMMKTPTTEAGLRKYDALSPKDAAVRAWVTPGVRPEWDAQAKRIVRDVCPLLARALDRMAKESKESDDE